MGTTVVQPPIARTPCPHPTLTGPAPSSGCCTSPCPAPYRTHTLPAPYTHRPGAAFRLLHEPSSSTLLHAHPARTLHSLARRRLQAVARAVVQHLAGGRHQAGIPHQRQVRGQAAAEHVVVPAAHAYQTEGGKQKTNGVEAGAGARYMCVHAPVCAWALAPHQAASDPWHQAPSQASTLHGLQGAPNPCNLKPLSHGRHVTDDTP